MTEAAITPPEEPTPEPTAPVAPTAEEQIAALTQKLKSSEGRDQALTRTAAENKQLAADLAAARGQLAEIEQQNMSELEKAQKARDKAISEAAEAKAEARLAILTAKFPLATAELAGESLPSEEALARLEAKLTAKPGEPEPEPLMDKNNPRKTAAPATPADPAKALEAAWVEETKRIRGF